MEILVATNGPVMDIRLSRPEKKNAITVAMYAELADAVASAAGDPDVRVITITGAASMITASTFEVRPMPYM